MESRTVAVDLLGRDDGCGVVLGDQPMTEDTSTPADFEEKWAEWESNLLDPPAPQRAPTVLRPWPATVWARSVWAKVWARLVALLARPRGAGSHYRERTGGEVWRNVIRPYAHVAVVVLVACAATGDVIVWAR